MHEFQLRIIKIMEDKKREENVFEKITFNGIKEPPPKDDDHS